MYHSVVNRRIRITDIFQQTDLFILKKILFCIHVFKIHVLPITVNMFRKLQTLLDEKFNELMDVIFQSACRKELV